MRGFLILALAILLMTLQSKAKTTNWTGTGSGLLGGTDVHNWFNLANWDNGVPAAGDIVQIGVNAYTAANYPIIDNSTVTATVFNPSIGNLIFGVATTNGGLVVNSGYTLTVTGNITIEYNNSTAAINILGLGTINCMGSFLAGDSTAPSAPSFLLGANITNLTTINLALQSFIIGGNLTFNTTSATGIVNSNPIANVNNVLLNLLNGTLSVTGNISTTNSNYVNDGAFTTTVLIITKSFPAVANSAQLLVNPAVNTTAGTICTLSIGGSVSVAAGGFIDFYGSGAGACYTIYNGNISTATQTIYSTTTSKLDTLPSLYQHLTISGASPKTVQSGYVDVGGNWVSSGAFIDATSNSGTVRFRATGAQSLTDNGSHGGTGVIFNNVVFQGTGTKNIATGNFAVGSTGILTMSSSTSLTTNGLLTLMSTSAGTASVAAMPRTASITGNVKSQRFIKGSSPTDLSKRGYRLMSSPVYTVTSGGVKYFDLRYLLDSAYVSGAAGGGFNITGNPTLYLYREDISTSSTNFTTGNWKGIANINTANVIGTQTRLNITNTVDTTLQLPVGNGFLFFFRGNKTNNTTQTGSKTVAPYDYPEDVIFTQTGQLNTGAIDVTQWYSSPSGFSFTSASNVNNSAIRGFVFVGNPYPSTINFEKFNRQGTNSSIYGGGFPAPIDTVGKIWVYNPTNKQYETYMQSKTISTSADTISTIKPGTSVGNGDATNMIASGQGFFIKANTRGRSLSFRETAKTGTQPLSTNINHIMSAPANNMQAFSSASTSANSTPALSMLSFKLAKDSINTDNAVLVFNNNTPAAFSDADDAEDLNGNGAQVSLSIMSSDSVATSIKRIKLPTAGQQQMRLLVDATASGRYHLNLENIQNMPNAYDIWLMDSFTKDSLDLKHNSNYDFDIDKSNAATFGSGRFSVLVRLNPAAMMHTLSVTAVKTIQGAQVSWRTENEGTTFTFSIEKSVDGKSFNQIGQLSSNGSGDYAYTDITPDKGINYYKVKLQDLVLNTISYSSILSLNYAEAVTSTLAGNISIYPNPATTTISIKMSGDDVENNSYSIMISNSSGRLIKQMKSSSSYLQTNISDFLPGTYVIQIVNLTDNKLQGQTKFVKL
ncbi:T9SS type A sorting domain-containing protein [Mucilaginibacter sp. dw_454]|uniref:T9SS type A sorting domain-containing protein n=1 Tax=Mucilaginibacter sp. dw_454 TaxID=2720079 RepID=UPI001BD56C83|nr:T9SS type A sorting domain-containing protein [Mucilaginibacter sp. dw_454]